MRPIRYLCEKAVLELRFLLGNRFREARMAEEAGMRVIRIAIRAASIFLQKR